MGKCGNARRHTHAGGSSRRLREELADNQLLNRISHELLGAQDLDALYGKLVKAGAQLMRAQFASMQMLQADQHGAPVLKLLANHNFSPEAAAFWEYVEDGAACACGAALARGQRVVVPDVGRCAFMRDSDDLAVYLQTGIRAVQTTPLTARSGQLVGAISTHWDHPHQPSRHQLQLFDILARQAADLIERVKVEETLRSSEARFRRALQPANVGVIFFDANGHITEANNAFQRMSGFDGDDVKAGRLHWDGTTPPEWRQNTARAMAEFDSKTHTTPLEKEYVRKDGTRWWALFCATRLSEDEGVGYIIDITDRKHAEQALHEADRRKDEFLATLAHELRNPLAPISNATQLLRRPDGRRAADRLIEMVERQVRQLVRLVNDLMEVSRITRGKIALEKAPIQLAEVISGAIETSQPAVEQGRHELSVHLPAESMLVEADSTRLTQVFANLLNNAARYTASGGHIWVNACREDGTATAVVRDNGIGISPERLPHVFDLFAQGDRPGGFGHGGLGVGLTMVRDLVRMHGGTAEVHSKGVGQGTEVVVRLPLVKEQAASPQGPAPGAKPAGQLARRRVLIVDDNRDAADSLCMLLASGGADAHARYDGPSALAALAGVQPNVVILDIGMPGMDGYEVAKRIRADPRFGQVRIVALTGWGQQADRARSRESGVDYHLTKPADLAELEDLLAACPAGQ